MRRGKKEEGLTCAQAELRLCEKKKGQCNRGCARVGTMDWSCDQRNRLQLDHVW